ncbi:MAG: hypothetical protein Q7R43_06440 [Candidatus Daviesbacteria bacterium]|nr:hypothetical protein [Candidatus Daviesbacteria bacterium]
MDPRNKVIIFGGVGLLILAGVLVSLFYVLKSAKVGSLTQPASVPNSLSRLPSIATTPSATNTNINSTVPILSDDKIFKGQGFTLSFPNNWGLLTCGNSNNFEFDPNGGDMKNVACDNALKPVTFVVVSRLNCSGDPVKLGNNHVTKTKTISDNGDVSHRWCTMVGNIGFDISHRVSSSGSRATSKNDYSKEVEKIITSLNK